MVAAQQPLLEQSVQSAFVSFHHTVIQIMSPDPSSPAKLIKTPIRVYTLAFDVPFSQPVHFLKKSMNGKEGRRVSASVFRIRKKKFTIQCHIYSKSFENSPNSTAMIKLYRHVVREECPFKGRWKRETMGVRKEPNVRQWSQTVAIEVYLQFEHAAFE